MLVAMQPLRTLFIALAFYLVRTARLARVGVN